MNGEYAIDNIVDSKSSHLFQAVLHQVLKFRPVMSFRYFSEQDQWKDLDAGRFNGRRTIL